MNTASPTALKLSNFPVFKVSDDADPYVQNWFFTHARIAPGLENEDFPVVYFPIIENSLPVGNEREISFHVNIGPLRIRGTLKGSQLNAQFGISPDSGIFYKLDDLDGDLSKGPVDTKDFSTIFYKGKVTVSQSEKLEVVAKIDWVGLGTTVNDQIFPLVTGTG